MTIRYTRLGAVAAALVALCLLLAQPHANASALAPGLLGDWHCRQNGSICSTITLRQDGTYLYGGSPAGRWTFNGRWFRFGGTLAVWDRGRARVTYPGETHEGKHSSVPFMEFYWRDAGTGLMQYFVFTRD